MNATSSHIVTDPAILGGKPHIEGTRLGVELLKNLFANGWTRDNICETYPYLSPEAVDEALKA